MGDYNRSTRECTFQQLQHEFIDAIREHAERFQLDDVESGILICCETLSERKKKGFFSRLKSGDPDEAHHTAALVRPPWLIWGTSGEKRGAAVLSMRLSEIEVTDYANSSFAKMIEDSGLQVLGFPSGGTERASVFIGMGPGPAFERFKEVLFEAIGRARGRK